MANAYRPTNQQSRVPLPDVLSGFDGSSDSNQVPTISESIPGLEALSGAASSNIGNLLDGLPSAPWSRTQNAYWGAASGQPGTGGVGTFIGNRGADLYHTQAQANQQQGLDNLLKMVQGYSGTVAKTPGQIQQGSQFDRSFAQQQANDLWNQLFQERQLTYNQNQNKKDNYVFEPGDVKNTAYGATAYPKGYWRKTG